MIFAGCDVGSLTSKAVLMQNNKIKGYAQIKSRVKPENSANEVMQKALDVAGVQADQIGFCVGTGYGREKITFVDAVVSEITCHAQGALWLSSSARTIIDIGGQDCKVMQIDADGQVLKFITNDKCASGTGRFLEVMAKALGVEMDQLGAMSFSAKSPITFASTCTVWAQADVVKFINDGRSPEDIGAGINNAMANRVAMLVGSVKVEAAVFMTGGVAKNKGVVKALAQMIGRRIKTSKKADPQLAGAIGAALIASQKKEA